MTHAPFDKDDPTLLINILAPSSQGAGLSGQEDTMDYDTPDDLDDEMEDAMRITEPSARWMTEEDHALFGIPGGGYNWICLKHPGEFWHPDGFCNINDQKTCAAAECITPRPDLVEDGDE